MLRIRHLCIVSVLIFSLAPTLLGQGTTAAKTALGSETAKNGFRNEDDIAAKFNDWRSDAESPVWLAFMGFRREEILSVAATKPHGEKADIVVRVRTKDGERAEGVSIKLVSSRQGFNQIDKRWLGHYVTMWKMPADVEAALKLFTGETPPSKPSRRPGRMFLNELTAEQQKSVVDFFSANKHEIVSDLFRGDGEFSAGWIIVAQKVSERPWWVLRSIDYAIRFFSAGPVELTRSGNLKIGRITMQRKGGDGGRETANMLQFKIDPTLLFEGGRSPSMRRK